MLGWLSDWRLPNFLWCYHQHRNCQELHGMDFYGWAAAASVMRRCQCPRTRDGNWYELSNSDSIISITYWFDSLSVLIGFSLAPLWQSPSSLSSMSKTSHLCKLTACCLVKCSCILQVFRLLVLINVWIITQKVIITHITQNTFLKSNAAN